jgi:predicted transcriptional regulator
MATVKQEMLNWVQALPDECTWDDMRYLLYVHEKVSEGLSDVKEGRVVPQDEAKRRMREWVKSLGPKQP